MLLEMLGSVHCKEGQNMVAHLNTFEELYTKVATVSSHDIGITENDLVSILDLLLPHRHESLMIVVQSYVDTITRNCLLERLLQGTT